MRLKSTKKKRKMDLATTEAKEEKQTEEIIEHATDAPHPRAPKSGVLKRTSVLDTRDAKESQECSKEFLEIYISSLESILRNDVQFIYMKKLIVL